MESSPQIAAETALERRIVDVLANVDRVAIDSSDRRRLRLVALLHDASKVRVDRSLPRRGANHHARLARRHAERFTDDPELLKVIELHDDAYDAWLLGARGGDWVAANAAAQELIENLGDSIGFYLRFYEADNATGDKDRRQVAWLSERVQAVGGRVGRDASRDQEERRSPV